MQGKYKCNPLLPHQYVREIRFHHLQKTLLSAPSINKTITHVKMFFQEILIIICSERRFAALSRQVWHLVAQTPLVRGLPPNTPRKYVSW